MSVIWNWLVAVFAPLTWLLRLVWRPLVWFFGILVGLVLIGVAAYGLWTAVNWGWSFAANLGASNTQALEPTEVVVIVPTMTPIPVATETLEPTATAEPTSVVKAAKAKPAKTKPAAGQKVVQQPTVVVVQQPTVMPTAAVMVPIREGSPSQKCGYQLPADWVSIPDGAWMTGNGIQASKAFTVPSGKVGFVWGTDVDGLGRVLLVQKGPWSGTRTVFDGAYRVGSLSSSTLESATAHMQAFLQCEYAGVWGTPQYAPPNQ